MQKFILQIIKKAGKRLLRYYGRIKEYEFKYNNPKEIVTVADKEIENFIKQQIEKRFPGHIIIAEESENRESRGRNTWYIDPIDGTTNFVHNFPFFGIAIAYEEDNRVQNSAIYFPALNELFWAERGKGAFKNNKRIYVSGEQNINNTLLATGFACLRAGWKENNLKYLNKILPLVRDIRRTGSACFDMCAVACGRIDGFWELNLSSWDVMAGTLIVEEAGGIVTDFENKNEFVAKREIVATNRKIHQQLLEIIGGVK